MKPVSGVFNLLLFFLFSLAARDLSAQEGSPAVVIDTSQAPAPAVTFTTAALFSSGIDYFGQTTDKALPYLALNGTLRFKSGLYAAITGFHLLGDSALISATGLTAGYAFNMGSRLTTGLDYTYTIFPGQSPFLQASSPHMVSGELNYAHKIITGVGVDYSFGKQQDVFVSLRNSKAFVLNANQEKYILTTTPQLTVVAGTQRFYETYFVQKENNGKGKGSASGMVREESRSYDRFGFLSYNLKTSLSYNRSSYLVDAAYQLSLLGNNVAERAGHINSFFTLGFYYQF